MWKPSKGNKKYWRLNLLVIIHNQINTGPFQKVLEMCHYISLENINVTLTCTSEKNRFKIEKDIIDGVNVIQFPDMLFGRLRQGIDIWNLIRRIIFLRKINFDIIHIIDCRPVVIFPALVYKFFKKVPLIISWWDWFGKGGTMIERSGKLYSNTFGIIETFFEERFRKYADYATVATTALRKRLVELNYPEEKIFLVRIGCSSPRNNLNKDEAKELLKIDKNQKIMCYLGSLFDRDKELLIDSLRFLKTKIQTLPLIILIGKHNIENNILKEFNILLTGKLEKNDTVYNYLSASDFGLLPFKISTANISRWPSKVGEYLRFQLPIVLTPVSDFPEITKNYQIGYIAEVDSSESYGNMIYKALSDDEEKLNIIKNSIKNFVDQELNWKIIADKLINIYNSN